MDSRSLVRTLLIAGVVAVLVLVVGPKLFGTGGSSSGGASGIPGSGETFRGPPGRAVFAPERGKPVDETLCTLRGPRFAAQATTRGASLKHVYLDGAKYKDDRLGIPMDLVTTPDIELQPLRTEIAAFGAASQTDYDYFDYKIEKTNGEKSCTLVYEDEKVRVEKTFQTGDRPFEIEASLKVTNKKTEKATHRVAWELPAFRRDAEIEGGFGRQSPFTTTTECFVDGKMIEKTPGDFAESDFKKDEYKGYPGWFTKEGDVSFASTSNFYFAGALVPLEAPSRPACQLRITAPVNEKGALIGGSKIYRSRLLYAAKDLGAGESASYKILHFVGPKERDTLAAAGGGSHKLSELIKLGTFAFIAKYLVWFLVKVQGVLGNWGLAIVALTVTVRLVLFPLMWASIKSGAMMRKLKPEIDKINEKYKDDAQQKLVATQELWRKHGVNPFKGCAPVLVQMPVWFSLYTSLQTAAELYHTPFLWFKDLSAPDTFHFGSWDLPFLLPWLLGGTSFLQQKLMPPGQMDPQQQKLMTYLMPAIFTAMMLFLPSGLGVYMLTNSVLAIVQQVAVERYYKSQEATPLAGSDIGVREKDEPPPPSKARKAKT